MSTGQSNYLDTQTRLIEALRNTVEGVSWGEFFSVYDKMIYSIARKKGLSHEDSQEVTQETIIKAHKNIKKYDPARGTFRNWLGVITKSCVTDCVRKRGRRLPAGWQSPSGEDDILMFDLADPDDQFNKEWNEQADKYMGEMALERLRLVVKPRDFQVFHCAKILEWNTERICDSLGITANNMYQIINQVSKKCDEIVSGLQKEKL